MKILMISADPAAVRDGSEAQKRLRRYAEILGEIFCIVAARSEQREWGAPPLFLYPAGKRTKLLRFFSALRLGKILCAQNKFDAITAQDPHETGIIAYLLARAFRIPLQLQIHTDIMSPFYRRAGWKEYIRFRIACALIPRADSARVVSERIKRSLVEAHLLPESKITVLPVYTDFSDFEKSSPGGPERLRASSFKMVAYGRFAEKEKNFRMLISMMGDLIKTAPEARLALIGSGPARETYVRDIKNRNLGNYVIVEEWRNDLGSHLKTFDLFLLSSNFEGWGRAALEAMYAGLPVVMTDVGLAGEIVKNGVNGTVVPVADERKFLEAVADMYHHSEKRILFAKNGQETAFRLAEEWKAHYAEMYRKSFEINAGLKTQRPE